MSLDCLKPGYTCQRRRSEMIMTFQTPKGLSTSTNLFSISRLVSGSVLSPTGGTAYPSLQRLERRDPSAEMSRLFQFARNGVVPLLLQSRTIQAVETVLPTADANR